ncbi:MAG: 50S ribosomal protein L6 [Nanoarchaeota archaeon]
MKKDIERVLEIPEGFEIEIENSEVSVKKSGKILKKKFDLGNVNLSKSGNQIKISAKKATKKETKIIGTTAAHIANLIKGLQEEFVYKLEICNVHFPMNVKVEGNNLLIKTFLGETVDRHAEILQNVKAEVKGHEIILKSCDKEAVGQTAANIERATKVKGRDRRVFQDGIFLTERCGRKI